MLIVRRHADHEDAANAALAHSPMTDPAIEAWTDAVCDPYAYARNNRGIRNPQQAHEIHEEQERAYVRSLRNIGKTGASLLLAAFLSLPAFAAEPCRINVNSASPAQLLLFSRTGPVLAGRLASGRPYRGLNDVDAVKGVGPAWLAVNGPHVAFSGATTCTEKIPTPNTPKVPPPSPLP